MKKMTSAFLWAMVFALSACAESGAPIAVANTETETSAPTTTTTAPTTTTTAPTTTTTAPTTEAEESSSTLVAAGEVLDVGDPAERTGLWSSDTADHDQALANVAAAFPLTPESFIREGLEIEYGGLDPADFVEHARLTTSVLIENGFELQYSRCWIGREQDIVEFLFDSGNNYWVWKTWNPNDRDTGAVRLYPTAIGGAEFDVLRTTQEELIEFIASGRYPFETGADPECAPILE